MTGAAAEASRPAVSVVVVTHDDRDRLLDCLQSLEEQTLAARTIEVIVVDDGSRDGTAAAVRRRFSSVRVIEKANEGADLSRNRGIEASSGGIVAFIDSDCVAPPDWLERMVGVLDGDPSAVVGGRVVHRGPFLRRVVGVADFGEYLGATPREARCLPTCNLGAARSTLGATRFEPGLAEAGGDTLFTETLRRGGALLLYHPEVWVEHRPSVELGDLVRRAGRYGRSFVRARRIDPTLRWSGLVRAGVSGVIVATFGRILLDFARLLRHRRAAGFSPWQLPPAAALLAVRRLASLPSALRALRD